MTENTSGFLNLALDLGQAVRSIQLEKSERVGLEVAELPLDLPSRCDDLIAARDNFFG